MDDDLPPDLVRLRTLETWAAHYLTRIRERIAAVERQQQAQPRQPPLPTAEPASPAAGPGRAVPVRRTGAWRRPVSESPPRRSTGATAGPGAGRWCRSARSVPAPSWPTVRSRAWCAARTGC